MYLSIIFLPLLGSVVSGFFGRKVGVTGAQILACLSIISTTILSIVAYFEVGFNRNPVHINLFNWITSESFNITWSFQFDNLTVSMLIPVLIISSLVHLYSIGYMSSDPHNQRFFSYLGLFTFMMIILVTGNNYLLMFVGWEGVGVCSYLLVSFWFTRIAANQSSISAFLTNRVGDCLLTIGMFSILWSLGNLDYTTVFSLAPYVNENTVTIIGICLLIGAMAKSSQVGLHVWLPMAMEGPTPVSALIHAATMVTAGVYLLIRSSPLIEYSSTVLLICLWLGAITTLFSSLIGFFQADIKKIIAYSTMSQLGMMVISIGLSSYNIALFHLMNHAFYKGLLFLGAGSVIHAVVDNQDLRKYGGLIRFLPLTYTVILIASLSLVAFPYMTGFYSKDFILESAYGQYNFHSVAVYFVAVIGAIFTTLYSVKILYLTFLANPNGSINYYKNAHESDIFMSIPLVILAIFSVYFGFLTKDIYIGMGSGFFSDNSIFIHPLNELLINTEFGVPTLFKLLPLIFTISFTIISIIYSEFLTKSIHLFKLSNIGYYIFGFFNQRFLIEFFYNKYIVNLVLKLGGQTTKILDRGSIELIGPFGLEKILLKLSKIVVSLSSNSIPNYALFILIGLLVYNSIYYNNWAGNILIFNLVNIIYLLVIYQTLPSFDFESKDSKIDNKSSYIKVNKLESNILLNFIQSFFKKVTFVLIINILLLLINGILGINAAYLETGSEESDSESKKLSESKSNTETSKDTMSGNVSSESKGKMSITSLLNTEEEEKKLSSEDKGKSKEVLMSDADEKDNISEKKVSNEVPDLLAERFKYIHEMMIKHTQNFIANTESELKKEDLLSKDDSELTEKELKRKEELLKIRERDVEFLIREFKEKTNIEEQIISKDKEFQDSSNLDNKRSIETKDLEESISKKNK